MILRYYWSYIKKQTVSFLFPLIYMIPILILVFINITSAVGRTYQRYSFHLNSNFTCVRDTSKADENTFLPYTISMSGKYSEELSLTDEPFYYSAAVTTLYFYQNPDIISVSYFTEKNLLSGSLPNKQNFKESQKNNAFPICITYDVAQESDSGIGDFLDLNGTVYETQYSIRFQIVGILYSDGMDSSQPNVETQNAHLSCALVSKETFERLPELVNYGKTYYVFSDHQETEKLEGQNNNITLDSLKTSIIQSIDKQGLSVSLSSAVLIIIALCIVTHSLMRARIDEDMNVLGKIGFSKNKISIIHFMRSLTILLFSLIITGLFVSSVYLPLIAKQYYDIIYIGGLLLCQLIFGGAVCFIYAIISRKYKTG